MFWQILRTRQNCSEYLSREKMKRPSFPDRKVIYLTAGTNVVNAGPGDEMGQSKHEEADT